MPQSPSSSSAQPHLARLIAVLGERYEALPLWEESGRARLGEAQAVVAAGKFRVTPHASGATDAPWCA
jgi:hydroxypyruvate reductase